MKPRRDFQTADIPAPRATTTRSPPYPAPLLLDTNAIRTAGKRAIAQREPAVCEAEPLALCEARRLVADPLQAGAEEVLHSDLDALDRALFGAGAITDEAVGAKTVGAALREAPAPDALDARRGSVMPQSGPRSVDFRTGEGFTGPDEALTFDLCSRIVGVELLN